MARLRCFFEAIDYIFCGVINPHRMLGEHEKSVYTKRDLVLSFQTAQVGLLSQKTHKRCRLLLL